jgi:DNA invertase Pin-like site-specific DNA recombinase
MTTYAIWCPEGTAELGRLRAEAGQPAIEYTPTPATFKASRETLLTRARGQELTVVVPSLASLTRVSAADALAFAGQLAALGCRVRSLAEPWFPAAGPQGRRLAAALGQWAAGAGGDIQRRRIREGIAKRQAAGLPQGGSKPGRTMPRAWSRQPPVDWDALVSRAREVVTEAGTATQKMLETEMHVGPLRARELMERLEAAGVVGPARWSRPREVLAK